MAIRTGLITTTTRGLDFVRCDLHVHTPASRDFTNARDVSPQAIVDAAVAEKMAAIAITDHQTGEWIDRIKLAAKAKGLTIFPGVELLVSGGERGVHIIVLFDVDKDSKHVEQFLNKLGIYDKRGEKTVAVDVTVGQVADELDRYDPSGILLLPHCASSSGVLAEMKGELRTVIFEERRRCILGAETSEADFKNEEKIKQHKRVIDLLDGTDPNYHKRKMGVYTSSDAHSIDRVGKNFTWFKVDSPIEIEDLRQCLIDREVRIRQSFEFKEDFYPRISSLRVNSGFLADQTLVFHEGLNSILGAKGAGKSLAIEFLRFALDQPPNSEELRRDHDSKIDKCLRLHGNVVVEIADESGKAYEVRRTYNPAENSPISITDLGDGSNREFDVDQVFPVLFLSQGEVARIAEDGTGASQRKFIDTFFDFHHYRDQIELLNRQLRDADSRFVESLKAHIESSDLAKKIATLREEIQKLERQIRNPAFDEYSKREKVGRAILGQRDFVRTVRDRLGDTRREYDDLAAPTTGDTTTGADPGVKRASGIAQIALTSFKTALDEALLALDAAIASIQVEFEEWESLFKPARLAYEEAVKSGGGTQAALDQARKNLLRELAKLEVIQATIQGKVSAAELAGKRRNEILDRLDAMRKQYFDERKKRCDYFTSKSAGTLNVSIGEGKDTSAFREALSSLKRGSWLREEDIEKIAATVSPRDFVTNLFRFEWSRREKRDYLVPISTATGMKPEPVLKLAEHLLDAYEYTEILALLYRSVPEDVPVICYNVNGKFKALSELSVGQKAVALLIIALSDGQFPIVIDQPEDSLDLRTIWESLCDKLRHAKSHRQFIFTTHNSSVAVASDSDKFTILVATADRGEVLHSGSMNRKQVRDEVISYLEGGRKTYDHKRRKYNL